MFTLIDTDARVDGGEAPPYIFVVGEVCLGIYTLELMAGFFVDGRNYFKKKAILFDLFTVYLAFFSNSFLSHCLKVYIGIFICSNVKKDIIYINS